MQKESYKKVFVGLLIFFIALLAMDQIVKHLTDIHLSPVGTSVPFVEGLIDLTSVHNTGAAFGMFQDGGWILAAVRIITSGALVYAMIRWRQDLYLAINIALTAILAGAIGNLIDHILLGYVRDMFEFAFISFPVFNMADAYVTVGSIALFALVLFSKKGRAVLDLLLGQNSIDSKEMENNNG